MKDGGQSITWQFSNKVTKFLTLHGVSLWECSAPKISFEFLKDNEKIIFDIEDEKSIRLLLTVREETMDRRKNNWDFRSICKGRVHTSLFFS